MKIKSILTATSAVLLATGFLCQTAKANLTGDVTLYNNAGGTFTVDSSATFDSVNNYYYYSYVYSGAPNNLASLSVYFTTLTAGVVAPGGGTAFNIYPGDVNWTINDGLTSDTLSFWSPLAPTLGNTEALDGGSWGNGTGGEQYGVVVPNTNVPDNGLTMSLLGGTLLGLGALRRKLGC
jgi:hypothetical protein